MDADGLAGRTVRWTYDDGPMRAKHFEHAFSADGTVTWKEAGEDSASADSSAKYEFARIDDDAYVVSYLSGHGFTLTTIVDEKARTVVSFASNEKQLMVQHGKLEAEPRAA
ncbi:MAG: MoaF N-terminal domain [Chloroflexota bacterium]|nr:MoaF N-terminal domain [Chloroflexota bacterium]